MFSDFCKFFCSSSFMLYSLHFKRGQSCWKPNESSWLGHCSFVLPPSSPLLLHSAAMVMTKSLLCWGAASEKSQAITDKGEKIWERVPTWIEEQIACRKDWLPAGEELMLDWGRERIREGRQVRGACGQWWVMWASGKVGGIVLPHGTPSCKLWFTNHINQAI